MSLLAQAAGAATPPPPAVSSSPAPIPTPPPVVAGAAAHDDSLFPEKSDSQYQPVAFTRLVLRLQIGAIPLQAESGMFCTPGRANTWPGGQVDYPINSFKDPFRTEMVAAGLKVEGDPDNLFEANASTADFAVAGIITDLSEHYCTPNLTRPEQKGSVSLSIKWELYSRLQKQIVGTYETTGSDDLSEATSGGINLMLSKAFAANARQLAANPDFRKALSGAARSDTDLVKAPALDKIALTGALAAKARDVDATVSSVVLIRTGGDEGSGVLVSADGYILTAAHVVGEAASVKVRWSDGVETTASVARISKGRDVALLKTDPRGRTPLAMQRQEPTIGDPVFAVGSTMGDKFQSSVTKGVMSADRIIDGYSYIQSDVTVGPGASGGPLLDANGKVIGITVQVYPNPIIQTGIRLFVPIRDAEDFLGLQPG